MSIHRLISSPWRGVAPNITTFYECKAGFALEGKSFNLESTTIFSTFFLKRRLRKITFMLIETLDGDDTEAQRNIEN